VSSIAAKATRNLHFRWSVIAADDAIVPMTSAAARMQRHRLVYMANGADSARELIAPEWGLRLLEISPTYERRVVRPEVGPRFR
jgi:hypothetical protein